MKTINQSAKLHSDRIWPISTVAEWDSNDMKTFCEQDFKTGVEFAQRWISVEEETPEILTDVLLKLSNGKITIGCQMTEGFNVESLDERGAKVTHWRPIEFEP
jgi:hypothetical protein